MRPRQTVSAPVLFLLRLFFRYSIARDAYVLRFVGKTYGPVLVKRRRAAG